MLSHPFNEKQNAERLLKEYQTYDKLVVAIDFDNTIKPLDPTKSCEEVLNLLRRCSADPKIILCLWSICPNGEEQEKVEYCKSQGINIDYVNESPLEVNGWKGKKQYFNILLDDRAGLESAYNNLKYVLDNANVKFS